MEISDTLTTLYSHHLWANLRLLERCSQLTNEQLDSTTIGTFGSIRDTLRHIVTSEHSYVSRIFMGRPSTLSEDAPMTFTEMLNVARMTGNRLIEGVPTVRATDVITVDWDGEPRDVPQTILLTQVINHATEHRSQIMAIMTELGIEPPDLQPWQFFDEVAD